VTQRMVLELPRTTSVLYSVCECRRHSVWCQKSLTPQVYCTVYVSVGDTVYGVSPSHHKTWCTASLSDMDLDSELKSHELKSWCNSSAIFK
jgi:hypothetical protein